MMDQSHAKAVQEKEAKKRIELKMLAARLGGQDKKAGTMGA